MGIVFTLLQNNVQKLVDIHFFSDLEFAVYIFPLELAYMPFVIHSLYWRFHCRIPSIKKDSAECDIKLEGNRCKLRFYVGNHFCSSYGKHCHMSSSAKSVVNSKPSLLSQHTHKFSECNLFSVFKLEHMNCGWDLIHSAIHTQIRRMHLVQRV